MTAHKALNGLKTVWAVIWLSLLACISDPAHANTQTKQTMIYEVYAGGIHALQATLTIDLNDPDRYSIDLFAKTRGLLGRLAPWHGTFESHGWRVGDNFQPELHKSTTTWRDEEEIKEYLYNRDGSFKDLIITDFGKPPHTQDVAKDLTDQSTDALTATLSMLMHVAKAGQCEGSSDVFDGKRRFQQVFHQKKQEDLTASRYNIYNGGTQRCTVEVIPDGGAWYKKPRGWMSIQEQGREKGTMPTMWVGALAEKALPVPVKIFVKTNYGALVMHLTEYRGSNDDVRIADKRAELLEEE